MDLYTFSVIVPFKASNNYLLEMLAKFDEINYHNFEMVLLPDNEIDSQILSGHKYKIVVKSTGEVSPAIKRNEGASIARGDILAFIDEDAYPDSEWFLNIEKTFNSSDDIAGVCGPQLTPDSDPFWAKVSGAMYLSPLIGGVIERYTICDKEFDTDDWPTVNLCVKKTDFDICGGFDSSFWPGEDTKFCLDLLKKTKKRLVYNGNAVVYHHRRTGFRKHMRQVGGYGLHRGFFAKKFPETSLRLNYIIPSLFFIFVIFGWISVFLGNLKYMYFGLWALYSLAIMYSTVKVYKTTHNWQLSVLSQIYLVSTHFYYGFRFIKGFFSKNIYSRLSR